MRPLIEAGLPPSEAAGPADLLLHMAPVTAVMAPRMMGGVSFITSIGCTPAVSQAYKALSTDGIAPHVFGAMLDAIDDIVFAVSVPDFRLVWANESTTAYFQQLRGVAEPLGKMAHDLAYDSQRARLFEHWFVQAVNQGCLEVPYSSPPDKRLWRLRFRSVVSSGVCIAVVVNGRELTAEEKARRAAIESESMYRSLFKCMGVGAVFQASDGRIIAVNHAAEVIEGRTEAQMKGLTSDALDWNAVKDDGTPFPGLEHPSMVTLRTGKPQSNVIMGIDRPGGEKRWISINSEPVVQQGGEGAHAVVSTFHDITERRQLEADLAASVDLLRKLTERVPGVVYQFVMSPDGRQRIPYASDHAWTLMELKPQDVQADVQVFFDRVHPDDLPTLMQSIQASAKTMTLWHHEFRVVLPSNGKTVWLGGEAMPEPTEDGGIVWHGITRDISEVKAHVEHLFRLGHLDEGTGLPNRRYLNNTLGTTLQAVARAGGVGAFIQVDLDEFSQVNDALGHMAGDEILRVLAQRLNAGLADNCFVARLGGDEFAVLYQTTSAVMAESTGAVLALVERIRELIEQPVHLEHMVYTPRCSAGVSLFTSANASAADIMREADTALYRAKRSGRGKSLVFEDSMLSETRDRLQLSQDLRHAVHHGEIQVHIQSQFDAHRRLVGGELLARWLHPERGWISPAQFIPLAEETNVIHEIGDFMLRQACQAIRQSSASIVLSVNVSVVQFMAADFVPRVETILADHAVPPGRLTLEVTESLLIQDAGALRQKMERLSRSGVQFSIDDFGTGYSSLAYLKSLPIAELKIDQSFVRDIPADPGDVAIVQAMLSMARHFDLRVVAEGVENEEQFDFLVQHGCQLMQGYLLAKPVGLQGWMAQQG